LTLLLREKVKGRTKLCKTSSEAIDLPLLRQRGREKLVHYGGCGTANRSWEKDCAVLRATKVNTGQALVAQ